MQIKQTSLARKLSAQLDISFIPWKATQSAAGYDLRACIEKPVELYPMEVYKFPTGVHIYLGNPDMAGFYLPRSSNPDLILTNTVGLLDPDYTGESFLKYKNIGEDVITIKPGERIGQLVLFNSIASPIILVDEIEPTGRTGGFGSTGKI